MEVSSGGNEPLTLSRAWSDESLARDYAEELATEYDGDFWVIVVKEWDLGRATEIKQIGGKW